MKNLIQDLEQYEDCQDYQDYCRLNCLETGQTYPEYIVEKAARAARGRGIACEPPEKPSIIEAQNFVASLLAKIEAKNDVTEQVAKRQALALEWTKLREKPFLTPPEVAKLMAVGHNKVLRWIRSGKLKATNVSKTATPRYRISREAIQELETRAQPKAKRVRKSTGNEPTQFF